MNILEEIIAYKKKEVDQAISTFSLEEIKKQSKQSLKSKSLFFNAIKAKVSNKEVVLIAEVKKASPSKGVIRADFHPVEIAKDYESGGATCLSVLTDEKYFQGDKTYIKQIKQSVSLPILRKDFIIDPYQIYESNILEANCILLIVGVFLKEVQKLKDLIKIAEDCGLDILMEVHDSRELEIALEVIEKSNILLGINNRDLKTFKTSLDVTKSLVKKYERDLKEKIIVSESGINTHDDIKSLIESNVYCFLVGESLMRENDIKAATKNLIQGTK